MGQRGDRGGVDQVSDVFVAVLANHMVVLTLDDQLLLTPGQVYAALLDLESMEFLKHNDVVQLAQPEGYGAGLKPADASHS